MNPRITADDWNRIGECFEKALGLAPDERDRFLKGLKSSSPHIALEVQSLLENYHEADAFLENPLVCWEGVAPAGPSLTAGGRLGDYVIIGILGKGALATVYLAHEVPLNRKVALKVSTEMGNEARIVAPLEHDNIVRVFAEHTSAEKNLRWIAMQYVPGASLALILDEIGKREPSPLTGRTLLSMVESLGVALNTEGTFENPPLEEREVMESLDYQSAVLWIGMKIADALHFAHERGVLHLYVKPGNILLTPQGRPLLADFNVAVEQGFSNQLLGGTVGYMAPEQKRAFDRKEFTDPIDGRADIYSLGVVLKEMLEKGGVAMRLNRPVTLIEGILGRCLKQEPEKRYPDALALKTALQNALELSQIENEMPARNSLYWFARRTPLLALVLFALIPQITGSFVNIGYNYLRIVSHLTAPQQEFFQFLCIVYNAITYPVLLAIAIWRLWPVISGMRLSQAEVQLLSPEQRAVFREETLSLLRWMVIIIGIGWFPGGILFPRLIHLSKGPLGPEIFLHFFISFTLSGLIGLTYSALYTQYVALRLFYPHMLGGVGHLKRTAEAELKGRMVKFRGFQGLAVLVPLIGAIFIVLVGPRTLTDEEFQIFRTLVSFLIGLGIFGLWLALRMSARLDCLIHALTGSPLRIRAGTLE